MPKPAKIKCHSRPSGSREFQSFQNKTGCGVKAAPHPRVSDGAEPRTDRAAAQVFFTSENR